MFRKIALLGLLGLILAACAPQLVASDPRTTTTAIQGGYTVSSEATGWLIVGASREITDFAPKAQCQYRATLAGGPRQALVCDSPVTVTVVTTGAVNVRFLASP